MSQLRPIYIVKYTIVLILYGCMFIRENEAPSCTQSTHMAHSGIYAFTRKKKVTATACLVGWEDVALVVVGIVEWSL